MLLTTTWQNFAFGGFIIQLLHKNKTNYLKELCTWVHVSAVQIAQMTKQMSMTIHAHIAVTRTSLSQMIWSCLLALLQQSITQLGTIAQPSFALQNCKCLCGVGTCGRTEGCLIPPHQMEDSLTSRVADWDEDSHHDTSQYLERSHFTMADVFVWPQPYCLAVVQFRNILKKTSSLNCPQH